MPISVKCPECDAPYKVPDEAAGKAIKCKKCGAKISIPSPEADEGGGDDFAGAGAGAADGGGDVKEKKKSSTGKILAIVGALLATFCCVCGGGGGTLGYFYVYVPTRDAAIKIVADGKKAQEDFNKNFGKDFGKDRPMGKGVVAGGATILEKKETLTSKDPQTNGKPAMSYKFKLDAGKEYVIDMKSAPGKAAMLKHDPYLVLLDPQGKIVAQDDDSGGNFDAQIVYRPATAGEYTIQATYNGGISPEGLAFILTVKIK